MSQVIKIACIQLKAGKSRDMNIHRGIELYIDAVERGAQVICFPELSFTPFYPQIPARGNLNELAETIPGPTCDKFSELSKKYGTVSIVNLFEKRGNKTFDSSPVFNSDGTILGVTRMVHILDAPCFHEKGYYTPGDGESLVFATQFCRIGVAICYDRHFPEYMRTLGIRSADLVVVPQAGATGEWPAGIFEAEMQIAGFQNGYFVALCNRVGQEECITFEGKSFVTAPDGRIINQAPAGQDYVLVTEIDLQEAKNSHARNFFLRDRRSEIYSRWGT